MKDKKIFVFVSILLFAIGFGSGAILLNKSGVLKESENNKKIDESHMEHQHKFVLVEDDSEIVDSINGVHKYKCSICDEEIEEKHVFSNWISGEDNEVWTMSCNVCHKKVLANDFDVVKDSNLEIDDHEHNYEMVTNKNHNDFGTELDGTHTYKCSVCGKEKVEKHKFSKWYTIGEGKQTAWTLWCDECKQYVYTSDYEKVKNSGYEMIENEHEHNYEMVTNKNNNDFDTDLNGTHTYKCSICGKEKVEKHKFSKWYTLGEENHKYWTLWCDECRQYVYTTDYDKVKNSGYGMVENEHEHNYEMVTNKSNNDFHTELDGTHTYKCSVCGKEKVEKHKFSKWYVLGSDKDRYWTLWCDECKQYVYTTDPDMVKNSGYDLQ